MEVGHDNEADSGDDDTPELDAVVGGNAVHEIMGDLAIKNYDCAASGENN